MVSYATFNDLDRLRRRILNEEGMLKKASTAPQYKTVFLSHSSQDEEYLPAVINVLEEAGGSVYIDKADHRLPETPDHETAEVLRSTVRVCPRFVLFVTTNSKNSRWIPWELGLADGEKGVGSIALFPTAKNAFEKAWAEREYLGLYPRIVWGSIRNKTRQAGWIVLYHHNNTAVTLSDWLNGWRLQK